MRRTRPVAGPDVRRRQCERHAGFVDARTPGSRARIRQPGVLRAMVRRMWSGASGLSSCPLRCGSWIRGRSRTAGD